MATKRIVVTIELATLREVDKLVRAGRYPNRSKAVQVALRDQIARVRRIRLAQELSKMDPTEAKAIADVVFRAEPRTWRRS